MISTTNPRTGESTTIELEETTSGELRALIDAAAEAARALEGLGRPGRARLLEEIANALDADRDQLVRTADQETGLGDTRLQGELTRSVNQFRLFADAVREGSFLEAMIDHAAQTPAGKAPDLRRMLRPLGPVAVFGASNFPFAFSVAGGDTASALAAGCPVLLKAHDSHPLTSLRSFEAISKGVAAAGAPSGTVGLVFGQEPGAALIRDAGIRAVSFTGSLTTGQLLLDIVNSREEPIPFYGELSSLNPLVVTEGAAAARSEQIANGLFASVTGSGGQLCTKPGLAFVPSGPEGDQFVRTLVDQVKEASAHVLLNQRIGEAYAEISERLVKAGATVEARGDSQPSDSGFLAAATVLATTAERLSGELAEECFGPLVVVVRYVDAEDLARSFRRIPPSLTATIHFEPAEAGSVGNLTDSLAPSVGRIVYNGFPTGVRVSWAQHHGGPWPATNSLHTSVGVTAIRRFLRPFVWQDAPSELLPEELRDGPVDVPRRVDGSLQLAAGSEEQR